MRDGQIGDGEAAADFLEPFGPVLAAAVRGSYSDWHMILAANPAETAGLSSTARARFIHDRTVQRLAVVEAAGTCTGLRLIKIRGLYVVVLQDKLMLKLKKLDVSLRSRNIPTMQTQAFATQTSLLGNGFGTVTNAVSGYVLDPLGSDIDRIVVVCWDDDQKQWEVELLDSGEGGTVVTIPAAPAPPGTRTRIVADAPAASDESAAQ
jgi:hypothetical protein